jgi:hypothetical protein
MDLSAFPQITCWPIGKNRETANAINVNRTLAARQSDSRAQIKRRTPKHTKICPVTIDWTFHLEEFNTVE